VGNNDAKSEWLRKLLVGHEARLLRYVSRKVSNEAARDVVQEAFLRLWKEDETKLRGRETEWLFCVCRNLALDALKKEAPMRKGAKASPTDVDEIASSAENADAKLERQGEENAVNRIIGSLPDAQQEVVRLKFQEGFSYKEISSITGHSVSYVGVLIHEAMTRLRRELAEGQSALRQGGGR
jgi:RNA polymerase sigma factor (sigma-70 family)